MVIKDEYFVILVTNETKLKFLADFRQEFYCFGDLTELINDSYKFIKEDDAKTFIKEQNLDPEYYEVREINITYEII